jgi:hypothetical protein
MMRVWVALAAIAALLLIGAGYARSEPRSSWLEEAWTPKAAAETGGPAITLEGDGSVILVLPVATLKAALAAGLSTRAAVTAFLERYGQHCSDILGIM